jgi:hypothetical protein
MGKVYEEIGEALASWIGRQRMYFVGTAPGGEEGHVNVSPKGFMATFRILDPHTVAYLDLTGSGIETVAHVRENGRIVIMLCAFEGPPRIVRLHGRGTVLQPGDEGFAALADAFPVEPLPEVEDARRAVVRVDVTRIADSCGYAVPRMDFVGERDQLFRWADNRRRKRGPDALAEYRREMNAESLDGLPALGLHDPAGA